MDFLRNAVAAVQRNPDALAIYVAMVAGLHMLYFAGSVYLGGEAYGPGEVLPFPLIAYHVAAPLAMAVAVAAAQAVAFSRMGREIDRPLWKVRDDRDALRRFFPLWLVLNLALAAVQTVLVLSSVYGSKGLANLSLVLTLALALLMVPVGACMMFPGKSEWRDLGNNLAPLGRQFPRTLLLMLMGFFGVTLFHQLVFMELSPVKWVMAVLVAIIAGYIDCVIFAGAWLMCIEHRNTEEPEIDF